MKNKVLLLTIITIAAIGAHHTRCADEPRTVQISDLLSHAATGDIDSVVTAIREAQEEGFQVDLNCADSNGITALHYAALNGNVDMVKLLLKHGADPTTQTTDSRLGSAIEYAEKQIRSPFRMEQNPEKDKRIRQSIKLMKKHAKKMHPSKKRSRLCVVS